MGRAQDTAVTPAPARRAARAAEAGGRPLSWLPWLLAATSLALMAASVAAVWRWPAIAAAQDTESAAQLTVDALSLLGAPIVGAVVASRRPRNRYGWVILSLALSGALLNAAGTYGTLALVVRDGALPLGWAGAWLAGLLWGLTILHLPFLLLLFPDGRLPSPGWRWLVRAIVGLGVLMFATAPFVPGEMGVVPVPNPLGAGGSAGRLVEAGVGVAVLGLFCAILASGASVFARRRRAGLQERLQLRWFAYAAGLLGLALAGTGGGAFLITDPMANAVLAATALNAVFAAVGVAVLRYRLYEIDRIVSRAVSYALLTGLLAGVYVMGVLLMTRLLAPLGAGSELAVAGATLAAAVVFAPARRLIQAAVDRRFNRARYDAEQVVAAFRAHLRDELDLGEVVEVTRGAVDRTVAPARASLWLPSAER